MDPCNVCGGTDMNLVDGFYYCVECGTQDVNVRETVVEQTVMGDGTFAHTTSKRFTTVVGDGVEMSSEWYKWHTFNFILCGLTDELIALGAKPSVKMKVLWIWSRYVKQFQDKDEVESKSRLAIDDIDDVDNTMKTKSDTEIDREDSCDDNSDLETKKKSTKSQRNRIVRDIKTITKGTMLTILYVALNLDRSDIQLSHLLRFIREDRLSLYEFMKFVPKEMKLNVIKNWNSFTHSQIEYNPMSIRELAMSYFKILNLGIPLVPDLRKLVENSVQELCLPDDVKDLVFAFMHYMPVDLLHIDAMIQKSLVRIPDYEGICMAYILIALKVCFGLDDDYELRISVEVDKINNEENYLKSYKLGLFSEPCDRLFSFNQWCQHLQLRKHILCKNYLPMSRQFNNQSDDYTFMEHLKKRKKREIKLSDNVTMDILNKIKSDVRSQTIPKTDFPVTLTPMSTYVGVIAQRVQDPDLRLLLCEDFTQYSLKYAIKDLALPNYSHDKDNLIIGVCTSGKIFNKKVVGTLTVQEGDMTMVYVRNCQNKNWLKTESPKVQHVTKICQNDSSSDKESDHGYDSNNENSIPESQVDISAETVIKNDVTLKMIDNQDPNKCIFDDDFLEINNALFNNSHITTKEEVVDNFFEISTQTNASMQDSKVDSINDIDNCEEISAMPLDPNIYDRDEIIKELIEVACKKYKIPIPKESKQKKRKISLTHNEASSSEPKKKRMPNRSKPGEAKRIIDNLISAYYKNLQNDVFNYVSQQVKSLIEEVHAPNNLDASRVLDPHDEVNESNLMHSHNDKSNEADLYLGDNENCPAEINTNDSVIESNQTVINSDKETPDCETDNILNNLYPKSDPNFDENDHDISQLYVKIGDNLDVVNMTISDISNDPEIDQIISRNIYEYSKIDKNILGENKITVVHEVDSSSDSDDDFPLNILKETRCFERENEERKKEKLEPLTRDLSDVKSFNYWVRHYKSNYVVKSKDIGNKFDLELLENLPVSFVFIIRECAAVLGCSMFSLYKHMQNIEEILVANS